MFEKLMIQNFQAHDKLKINFDPGITTIVGPSDVGKTAIIRALRWVCTNQPGGGGFIRYGTKGAAVKLLVDGQTITRARSAGGAKNTYHINDKEYKAFGRDVPEPVRELLNAGPVCWQQQHDAPYWFSETAGEVSRQLNTIVNLGIIDTTLAKVNKAYNRACTRLEVAEDELTQSKAGCVKLSWVPEFNAGLCDVEEYARVAKDTAARAASVRELTQAAMRHKQTHDTALRVAKLGGTVVTYGRAYMECHKKYDKLVALAKGVIAAKRAAALVVPDIGALTAAIDSYKKIMTQKDAINGIITNIENKETNLCQAEKKLSQAEMALPKVCPVCGR